MTENRSKKLALFDFDNVIYKGHSIFDIIQAQEKDGFIKSGVWGEIQKQVQRYINQEISYKDAANNMIGEWARSLVGKSYQDAVVYVQEYFSSNPEKFFAWFEQLRPAIKSHDIFIITTNYQFIAEVVVRKFNLNGYISSEAEISEGLFTGLVGKSLAGNKGLVSTLLKRYPKEGSIAVGDSENDADMLEKVETPICFQPNEKLSDIATAKGWLIVDETSVLEHFQVLIN